MKKIILMLLIVLFALQLKAQLEYDKFGNIIPFSQVERYVKKINNNKVKTYILPVFDNDSLCRKRNKGKSFNELEGQYVSAISLYIDSFDLKKAATKVNLKEGTLWRFSIEGSSVKSIGIGISFQELGEGTYLAVIAEDESRFRQPPRIYTQNNLPEFFPKYHSLPETVIGTKLTIEYFEPKGLKCNQPIIVKDIFYGFIGIGNPSSENSLDLKSGFWGNSDFVSCQKDIVCTEGLNWKDEKNSVVYLNLIARIDTNNDGTIDETGYINGTGVFLNKVGNYNNMESPLLLTAGHLFKVELINGDVVDGYDYPYTLMAVTDYENSSCGDDNPEKNRGIVLPLSFLRKSIGHSFNILPYEVGYSASEDYAILQPNATVSTLSNYDVEYAAWSKNYDVYNSNNVNYVCIHHPEGDVKKINKDNNNATSAPGNNFYLNYDIGLTEDGSSGAPVFNSLSQVVGWHTAAGDEKDCGYIGTNNIKHRTTNGRISEIYFEISSTLDPLGTGSASSSNPSPPLPSSLPAHCRNCLQDPNETGIDCGGPCYPCGMQDVVALKTLKDIAGPVKSRYDLIADPDPNASLALKSGSYSLEAGMNIFLNGGFEVSKGAIFYASIDNELMTEADRGCQNPCIAVDGFFTPNGDGYDDFVRISQTFVTKYNIKVYTGITGTNLVYQENNVPVYGNGLVNIWDGTGAIYSYNRIILTYYDCNGNPHEWAFSVTAYGLKSGLITDQTEITTNIKELEEKSHIKVYPNPFSNKVSIEYTGNKFPLKYKVTDLNGKLITKGESDNQTEIINLNGFASGAYLINVKAGECNVIQKLIKE